MKHYVILLAVVISLASSSLLAQQRDAGQMVVPVGYENMDSVRFGIFFVEQAANPPYNPGLGYTYVDSLLDEVHTTFQHEWGEIPASTEFRGKRKGIMAHHAFETPTLSSMLRLVKQRIFYPSPKPLNYRFNRGYYWRYNDINILNSGARWYHNTYDANDINPYAEYDQNAGIVADTFHTRRFNVAIDSAVHFGNEGRVILGMSDDRLSEQMLQTIRNYFFPQGPGGVPDTAKQFSLTLDFNIDADNIDTAFSAGRSVEELPLLRLQVLYKQGTHDEFDGWPTLPLVPYRTASTISSNPGWYKIIDRVLTKADYDALDTSWRERDVMEDGNFAQPWRFKQLHLRLEDVPPSFKDLIAPDEYASQPDSSKPGGNAMDQRWGSGAAVTTPMTQYVTQDLLSDKDTLPNTRTSFLEIRILSTYRSTVRIRSLDFQDTIADKYFHRKLRGDSSYSCNTDGSYGGYDSAVAAIVSQVSTSLGTRKPREYILNDTWDWEAHGQTGLITSAVGYFDYMMSKHNIYVHYREQDHGNSSLHSRRCRLTYDGKPLSLYENQASARYAWSTAEWVRDDQVHERQGLTSIFPRDYAPLNLQAHSDSAWPHRDDRMFNIFVSRTSIPSPDTLQAYYEYTDRNAGAAWGWLPDLRATSKVALHHPKNKRFAVEAAVQGWFNFQTKAVYDRTLQKWIFPYDSARFLFRPNTPEEIYAHFYISLANGYTAFNNPQAFDLPTVGGGAPGLWGTARRTDTAYPSGYVHYTHDYNFGHQSAYNGYVELYKGTDSALTHVNTWTHQDGDPLNIVGDTSDCNGDLPDWYQGYSNTWRAHKRALDRINAIYSPLNSKYPFRRLQWLNAYSAYKALSTAWRKKSTEDSASTATGFIKVMKTVPVDPWTRGSWNEYVDLSVEDSAHRAYVEVGLFRDSLRSDGSPLGYAALVVNTRLWPGRDSADVAYYNAGLATKDQMVPTLGDIDVRKVYMKIDPTRMHSSMQSNYYVVRDIWHPDTTWLVHKDSLFAVYIKPGDAKFLYIQKGISILAAPTAETPSMPFWRNNARRVSTRLNGTKQAVAYSRNDSMFVSYPGIGGSFEGANERSSGDDVASGYEEVTNPIQIKRGGSAICTARNDTAIAMVRANLYGNQGRVSFSYQVGPGEPWEGTEIFGFNFSSDSVNTMEVTPVLTPINDTLWFVAARCTLPGFEGIYATRLAIDKIGDPYVLGSLEVISNDSSASLPTVTSRPLPDSMWPIRIAWQQDGHIYRRAIRWSDSLEMTPAMAVSARLPSKCQNMYPSIAMGAQMTIGVDTIRKITETIAWQAPLSGAIINSSQLPWIVTRSYTQEWGDPTGQWGVYSIFRPDTNAHSEPDHYPMVSLTSRKVVANTLQTLRNEFMRLAWHNVPMNKLESRHWVGGPGPFGWRKATFAPYARNAQIPQAVDSLEKWTTTSRVDPTIVYSLRNGAGPIDSVMITRGWVNRLGEQKTLSSWMSYEYTLQPTLTGACLPQNAFGVRHSGIVLVNHHVIDSIYYWDDTPPYVVYNDGDWTNDPIGISRSSTFTIEGGDSITVQRHIDTINVTAIQGTLLPGDHLTWKLHILRASDSSWVATLDSISISPSAAYYPGSGSDPNYAALRLSNLIGNEEVFITAVLSRGDERNGIGRSFCQIFIPEEYPTEAEKRVEKHRQVASTALQLTVQPNPFTNTTLVTVRTTEGMPTVIELSDVTGKVVQRLYDGEADREEMHLVLEGEALPSGTYFLRVVSGGEVQTRKIQLLK